MIKEAFESFQEYTKGHKVECVKDQGVFRLLKVSTPGTYKFAWQIMTFPDHLTIVGDIGSFTFYRLNDMFEFFRCDEMKINPGYWAEKVVSESIFGDGIREFSKENFSKEVHSELARWAIDSRHSIPNKEIQRVIEKAKEQIIDNEPGSMGEALLLIDDFKSYIVEAETLFQDFWEHDFEEYTFNFLLCCFAIVKTIQLYDKANAEIKDFKEE